jgi:hypothetical protein
LSNGLESSLGFLVAVTPTLGRFDEAKTKIMPAMVYGQH